MGVHQQRRAHVSLCWELRCRVPTVGGGYTGRVAQPVLGARAPDEPGAPVPGRCWKDAFLGVPVPWMLLQRSRPSQGATPAPMMVGQPGPVPGGQRSP